MTMLHQLQPNTPRKYPRPRVGRGGKRGTTAGHGQKGQKARSGRRIRPALRDYIQRIPKLRGHRNAKRSIPMRIVTLKDLETKALEGVITPKTFGGIVKILGTGTLTKKVSVEGLPVSESAKAAILRAGGSVK